MDETVVVVVVDHLHIRTTLLLLRVVVLPLLLARVEILLGVFHKMVEPEEHLPLLRLLEP